MMYAAVQLSFLSCENERPLTREERISAGQGARRLLAKVLYQALVDEGLAQESRLPDAYWPWNGDWTPRQELDAFWDSGWLAEICLWIDVKHHKVVEYVKGIRDGTEDIATDKRRKGRVV